MTGTRLETAHHSFDGPGTYLGRVAQLVQESKALCERSARYRHVMKHQGRGLMRGFYFPAVEESRRGSQLTTVAKTSQAFLVGFLMGEPEEQARVYWEHIRALEQLGRKMATEMGGRFWMIRRDLEDETMVQQSSKGGS